MAWLTGWPKRKKLTIDHDQVDTALSDFPVYVHLDGDTDVGAVARSDGYDLRFTSADGASLLKYEREYFNITGGSCTAHIWVKLPSISAIADTEFYVYYGKADASDGEDAENVWDDDYVAVWHMAESSWNGAAGEIKDATSNNNDGTRLGDATTAAAKIHRGGPSTGSATRRTWAAGRASTLAAAT